MNQTRKYATTHGTAFASATHTDNLYLTDVVVNGEVIETGRVIRLDRSTSKWLAQPACGCEGMSFDTLGDATCCLANHALNKATHSLRYNESTAKYQPVIIKEEPAMSECFHPSMYVTAWDDVTHTTPEEKEHAECEPMAHDLDCDCEACQNEAYDGMEREPEHHTCDKHAPAYIDRPVIRTCPHGV